MLSGTLLASAHTAPSRRLRRGGGSWATALGYALALAAAAVLLHSLNGLHPAFWFHKVRATPPWCLLSSAWTCAAWGVLYWVVDVRGWRRWPRIVPLAGENALIAYLLAPLLLSLFALTAPLFGGIDPYAALGHDARSRDPPVARLRGPGRGPLRGAAPRWHSRPSVTEAE